MIGFEGFSSVPEHCIESKNIWGLIKYDGAHSIKMIVPDDKELIRILRNKLKARWSKIHKVWHLPYNKENSHAIKNAFANKVKFNAEELKSKVISITLSAKR